jgi:FAD/FMN-containing dehydrogenase
VIIIVVQHVTLLLVEQLQNVIRCAAANNVHVCARNGGHSFTGASNCGDGIVVDVSALNEISLRRSADTDNNEARLNVGAGTRLGTMTASLYDHWSDDNNDTLYYMPTGHCATVGVSGLTLVGGHGIGARMFGLTSQRVTALEMIDAQGRLLKISPTSHADL